MSTDVLKARLLLLARERLANRPGAYEAFASEVQHGKRLGPGREIAGAMYWPSTLWLIAQQCPPAEIDQALIMEIEAWKADLPQVEPPVPPPAATPANPDVGQSWSLIEPVRPDALRVMIFVVLSARHRDGKPIPGPLEMMAAIKQEYPGECLELTPGELKYYDKEGNIKTATPATIRKRIDRLTGKKRGR